MIDDTPELKWSGAWWRRLFMGYVVPTGLVGFAAFCAVRGSAYLPRRSGRNYGWEEVYGFQAVLMILAYLALAGASFAYGYLRQHRTLSAYADLVLGLSLAGTFVAFAWCVGVQLAGLV